MLSVFGPFVTGLSKCLTVDPATVQASASRFRNSPPTQSFAIVITAEKAVVTAFSVNYFIPEDDMTVEDASKTLKIYEDPNTASGNVIQRHFCSNCGSAVFTRTPKAPGKVFLKATLFPTVAPKGGEVFAEKQLHLLL
ncbi:uncharacterized protein N7469_009177 [Penicillium citrinum]|uniref:CENP-V/GFA domain-containing protein n=1 Tax=Penicillium citrinum TaxID=5077 RepID=A0A9W9NMW8_PENCI|nr:uncharacterized protein N7469_009177 [Penicillium citrinum]KAJ5222937.1 hypothetical protein N7469_009177 [Penicillium citrinum]